MYHTPLQPQAQNSNNFAGSDSIYASGVNGEVSVHPSAAIAPGVLLQADPGCTITVGAGVCIGMGAIIHAFLKTQNCQAQNGKSLDGKSLNGELLDGKLEIGSGANLGAGVLILGNSKLGENCCIGSNSTVLHSLVESSRVLPPNSVLGNDFNESPPSIPPMPITPAPPFPPVPVPAVASNIPIPEPLSPEIPNESSISTIALEPSAAVIAAKSHLQKFMGKIYT
jgi:carbon dioxide concentrating mechanism protein CcmN